MWCCGAAERGRSPRTTRGVSVVAETFPAALIRDKLHADKRRDLELSEREEDIGREGRACSDPVLRRATRPELQRTDDYVSSAAAGRVSDVRACLAAGQHPTAMSLADEVLGSPRGRGLRPRRRLRTSTGRGLQDCVDLLDVRHGQSALHYAANERSSRRRGAPAGSAPPPLARRRRRGLAPPPPG